ncbi:MAG: CopD family protein [Betaproteobacteria bacterium]|nr:CopD family protein [Betaproteobacteria bacterium]MCL4698961.1 CopD family protein [Burkholderiaceae bacterium]
MPSLAVALLIFVHLLAAVVWVGGMVFAHFALRPAAVEVLDPPRRLPLLAAALGRFFRIVAVAVVVIVASGLALIAQVGFARAPVGWHVMLATGLVMAGVFAYIHAVLYPRLKRAVAEAQWPQAAAALDRIRRLVFFNLVLGVVTLAAAVSPRAG